MKKHIGGISVLCISAILSVAGWAFRNDRGPADEKPQPVLEVSREFELGEHELRSTVEASVVVRNRGLEPLVLDRFATHCGCLGVFMRMDSGERRRVEALRIPPRGEATLIPQLVVNGRPGVAEIRRFQFQTNDPRNATVEISMRVVPTACYFASPVEVALGTVVVGERVERNVEIRALDRRRPPITHATSSNDRFRVAYQPVDSSPRMKAEGVASELIGQLQIHFDAPSAPDGVGGVISLYCEDRQQAVVMIPVSGRVAHVVEMAPSDLMLPRTSSSGAIYTANCVCRSALAKPLRLAVQQSTPDISIEIKDVPANPSMKLIHIDATCLQAKVPAAGLERRIALLAEADGRRIPLTLKLTIRDR